MQILTPAGCWWNTDTWQILNDKQDDENDDVARPQSVTATPTEQDQDAEEYTVDHRVQIQTYNHRDDRHDETYLHSYSPQIPGRVSRMLSVPLDPLYNISEMSLSRLPLALALTTKTDSKNQPN